jgi:antitoxin (DNA-binding transcriptional repressor) of toxin-antitoxin stability system
MATTVKMHEAKTHLSSLVARAVAGEDIVIARGDKPMVKLVAIESPSKPKRVFGSLAGKISIPDDFFEPMSEEDLRLWEGN